MWARINAYIIVTGNLKIRDFLGNIVVRRRIILKLNVKVPGTETDCVI
jgi:hypothetical protein